jgi:signal transduction histidine kinase
LLGVIARRLYSDRVPPSPRAWELRFDWTHTALQWGALALGVFLSAVNQGAATPVILAGSVAGLYTVVAQVLPRHIRRITWVGEILAISGVIAGLSAEALTGAANAYSFFLTAPVFYAAAFHGFRMGLSVAVLASLGLVGLAAVGGESLTDPALLQAAALYALVAVAFGQARRLLIEEHDRVAYLRAASLQEAAHIERLAAAHNLLSALAALADESELNPISVGDATLRNLAGLLHFDAGQVVMPGDGDPITVARRGEEPPDAEVAYFPITIGAKEVGLVVLSRTSPFTPEERTLVEEALGPAALAFDNILLLHEIARRAVREERLRLARELHDEIGPALASLGLSLDVAAMQATDSPELAGQLDSIRHSVGLLVDEVRRTVSDLRHDLSESLVQLATRLAAEGEEAGIEVAIDLDERRPPRSSLAPNLASILAEAMRNAFEHSGAHRVVVGGHVDHDRGAVFVEDDGRGFDPDGIGRGHFGIIGMHERAVEIEADLEIAAGDRGGTRVLVSWDTS